MLGMKHWSQNAPLRDLSQEPPCQSSSFLLELWVLLPLIALLLEIPTKEPEHPGAF